MGNNIGNKPPWINTINWVSLNNSQFNIGLQWFGASKPLVYASGNIDNATRNLGNTVNTAVTGWTKTNDFIVAIALESPSGADSPNVNYRVEWRNKTDGGTFAILSSTGELRLGATDLVEGNSLDSGEAICTAVNGVTYVAGSPNGGIEKETGATFTMGDDSTVNMWAEVQISVDASNALDSKEYEFQVYDVDNSVALGPSLATITMEAGGVTNYKTVTGALTFAGGFAKATTFIRAFVGSLTFAGDVVKKGFKVFAGSVSFVGNISKKGFKAFTGALSFIGDLVATSLFIKAIAGAVSFIGDIVKTPTFVKALSGTVSFVGDILKKTSLAFTGAVSFIGDISKKGFKAFTGGVSFIGDLATAVLKTIFLSGAVTFTGAIAKKTSKVFTGSVSFIGAISKQMYVAFTGALTFIGNISAGKIAYQALSGSISFAGGFAKKVFKGLSGSVNFTGAIAKKISKTFTGAVSFVGNIFAGKWVAKAISGAVSFSGGMVKKTLKGLIGGISFIGNVSKKTSKVFTGALTFIGSTVASKLATTYYKAIGGVLSFSGNLIAYIKRYLIDSFGGPSISKVSKVGEPDITKSDDIDSPDIVGK